MRKSPTLSRLKSVVLYPSDVFSLEKDEIFPYERFAYNIIHAGVDAFTSADLPQSITVDFTDINQGRSPWAINASIAVRRNENLKPISFDVVVPEFTPAAIYLFCATVGHLLIDDGEFESLKVDPKRLAGGLEYFVVGASLGVRVFKSDGIGHAIRESHSFFKLGFNDFLRISPTYDLVTKFIAYHEIGHAYSGQLHSGEAQTDEDRRGFEFIADLLAMEWLFNKMIRLTPDDEEYRALQGHSSYRESILSNCLICVKVQLAVLLLHAVAGAQANGGSLSLSGGKRHPSGFARHAIQNVHFMTLFQSNFSDIVGRDGVDYIDREYNERFFFLFKGGCVPQDNIAEIDSKEVKESFGRAAELIKKFKVKELLKIVPLLIDISKR